VTCIHSADICPLHQHGVSGAGIHHHASVCVEQKEPLCEHELLWIANISSSLSALGAVCFLTVTRKLRYCRHIRWVYNDIIDGTLLFSPCRYHCRTYILFPGRCVPSQTRWIPHSEDPRIPVSWCAHEGNKS